MKKQHERLCDVRCIEDLFISKHNINVVIANTSVNTKKKKELEENDSPFGLPQHHHFFLFLCMSLFFSFYLILADGQFIWQYYCLLEEAFPN
jgi:hypothetical protein